MDIDIYLKEKMDSVTEIHKYFFLYKSRFMFFSSKSILKDGLEAR